jgi:hypothetical protein
MIHQHAPKMEIVELVARQGQEDSPSLYLMIAQLNSQKLERAFP